MKRLTTFVVLTLFAETVYGHGGGREIKGTIVKTTKASVQVKSTTGKVETLTLTPRTKFTKGETTAKPADMKVGSRVIVHLAKDGHVLEVQLPSGKTTSEKVGRLEGKIVGRDTANNELKVAHGDVKGILAAMTKVYHVHDARVSALPGTGTRIAAKLHSDDGKYWLTDVRAVP